jgi:hypothetical protein
MRCTTVDRVVKNEKNSENPGVNAKFLRLIQKSVRMGSNLAKRFS